jgi:hypothetical protein
MGQEKKHPAVHTYDTWMNQAQMGTNVWPRGALVALPNTVLLLGDAAHHAARRTRLSQEHEKEIVILLVDQA